MPKEVIHGMHAVFENGSDDGTEPVVEVRWNGETGDLQLATRLLGRDGVPYIDDTTFHALQDAGIASLWHRPENVPNPPYVCLFSEGMYVSLDRRAINDLIRKLRRARNAVFGADE